MEAQDMPSRAEGQAKSALLPSRARPFQDVGSQAAPHKCVRKVPEARVCNSNAKRARVKIAVAETPFRCYGL